MKLFIDPSEITKEMLDNKVAAKHLFNRVEAELKKGKLFLDDYLVEKMFVVDVDDKVIVEAIFNGYTIKTDFSMYDEESRNVDKSLEYFTVVDENGNEYNSRDYFITSDKEAAEEALADYVS